jgi:hypothetical protein
MESAAIYWSVLCLRRGLVLTSLLPLSACNLAALIAQVLRSMIMLILQNVMTVVTVRFRPFL